MKIVEKGEMIKKIRRLSAKLGRERANNVGLLGEIHNSINLSENSTTVIQLLVGILFWSMFYHFQFKYNPLVIREKSVVQ